MKRLPVLGLLVFALSTQARVLPPGTYSFRTYAAESGLGNLSAMRLAQDATGFLWVATQDGLYRYDGTHFRRFGLEDGLASTYVTTIAISRDGSLFAGTAAGVVRFDGTRFARVQDLPRTIPNALAVDAANRLWAAMPEGLFVSGKAVEGWQGEANGVFCDAAGDVWVSASGVIARVTRAGVWTRWTVMPHERIDAIVRDHEGIVWARSGDHLWSLRDNEVRDESAALPATSNNGYLALDARGNVWVPTDRGLANHTASGWRFITRAQGLPTDWARDVLEDREGSIWIASLGIHRMLGRGELTSYRANLPSEVTWGFRWTRDGHLLAGTDRGLARSTETGWSVVPGTEARQIRTFVEEPDGTIWCGGTPAEVLRIGKQTTTYAAAGRTVMRILRDRTGVVWVATRGGGLLRKADNEDHFTRADVPFGDATEDFRDLIEDRRGRLWAAGQHGLACYANGRWQRFTTADGLAHDHVAYLLESASGDLRVAYFEPFGIARIRPFESMGVVSIRVLDHLTTANGLSANKVFLIGEDKRGRLWIGTGAGVDVVSASTVERYTSADGLAGDDTDAMAFLCDDTGDVYVGTSSGFSRYMARSDPPRMQPPPVTITRAAMTQRRIRPDFDAAFSALTFFKPDAVEYEARLLGLDDAWQKLNDPHVQWTHLGPGEYRFEARARLRPGEWSTPASYAFAVLPPWWETWWARAAAVLLLAALAWAVHRTRVALLRRRNTELEALVEQRTRELAQANESLMGLSVTDPLTSMKNRRYLQLTIDESIGETLRRHEALERAGHSTTHANADLVFLMIDLDHFKRVNDVYGHIAGDEVLIELRRLLGTVLRESDTLVRWGGEELLCVARHASRTEAAAMAERIRAAVEQHVFVLPSNYVARLTCAVGFAAFPFLLHDRTAASWEQVVEVADVCLYAAKRAGRNCWVGAFVRDERQGETLVARIKHSLEEVMASGEIEVVSSKPLSFASAPPRERGTRVKQQSA